MKIHSIKHKNIKPQISYDIVEENINILSSARVLLDLEINEDINYNTKYSIPNYHGKWRLNNYGVPSLISKNQKNSDIGLSYFTISSNIVDIYDQDSIEYAGL